MADASNDFAALARQYLDLWGQALHGAASRSSPDPAVSGLSDMLDAWARQVGAQGGFGAALEHFSRQNSDWYAQMQRVAARFSGREHSASEVAAAWRDAFGGAHPFAGLVEGMRGPGLESIAQWGEAGMPSLHGLRAETAAALRMPAFGFSREHQERLQALALAQLRWQDAQQEYARLMAKTSRDAFSRFESKLAEHEEPGRQIGSVRALFDLWVDAAEEAWADMALSQEYRHAFGALVNAQMRQRAAAQAIGEQAASTYGWPERRELDSAHRKIAELERQLRRLQRSDTAAPDRGVVHAAEPAAGRRGRTAASASAKHAPAKRAPAKKTAVGKAAPEKAPAKSARKTPATQAAKKATGGMGGRVGKSTAGRH